MRCKSCGDLSINSECSDCQIEKLKNALTKIIEECPNPKLPYGVAVVEIAKVALKR